MERVGVLIHKLLDQYNQQAGASHLLITAQMLLNELQQPQTPVNLNGTIAVSLPAAPVNFSNTNPQPIEIKADPAPVEKPVIQPAPPREVQEPGTHLAFMPQWGPETADDIPTLKKQEEKQVFELNEDRKSVV